jgi:hypothetical protein
MTPVVVLHPSASFCRGVAAALDGGSLAVAEPSDLRAWLVEWLVAGCSRRRSVCRVGIGYPRRAAGPVDSTGGVCECPSWRR